MHSDDRTVGRVLSRRQALTLFSVTGAVMLSPTARAAPRAQASQPPRPACLARPEVIEGPYFVARTLNRSDIRSEPSTGVVMPGVPLTLTFNVTNVTGGACVPLEGAMVDVWQCDAAGEYSAFEDQRVGFDTRGKAFLRGYQLTDGGGVARFTTIYPGWYTGRAVHIHFKIRKDITPGQSWEFTSQLFFDDQLTDEVYARAPYAAKGRRDMRNANDRFLPKEGDQLVLALAARGDGFDTTFGVGLDLADAATGRSDGARNRPGGRPTG